MSMITLDLLLWNFQLAL